MAPQDGNKIPRKPVPSTTSQDGSQPAKSAVYPGWEKDFTARFRQSLSTKRMSALSRHSSQASRPSRPPLPPRSRPGTPLQVQSESQAPATIPRHGFGNNLEVPGDLDDFSYGNTAPSPVHVNIPLIPTPAVDRAHQQFRNQLFLLSETPLKWENPGLLDEAMKAVPLDRIYTEAEDEAALLAATAASTNQKARWAYQDCVIRALLKWFKGEYFTWVNNPPCSHCGSATVAHGNVAPNPMELGLGAQRVELYQCHSDACGWYERFPRYNDAFVLLQTRRGRCGEWANCFTMLCRAMGSRVRWVWNSEDHVWTEVYSEYRKRWIHVDACEGVFDKPTLYATGWNKKMAYCIAFGADGAMDVTGRYCRNPERQGLPRTRCPEAVLHFIMDEIRRMRRKDLSKSDKFKLEGEDAFETKELRHYYISAFVDELAQLVPGSRRRGRDVDAQKVAEGRQSGTAEWTRARGEDGSTGPENP